MTVIFLSLQLFTFQSLDDAVKRRFESKVHVISRFLKFFHLFHKFRINLLLSAWFSTTHFRRFHFVAFLWPDISANKGKECPFLLNIGYFSIHPNLRFSNLIFYSFWADYNNFFFWLHAWIHDSIHARTLNLARLWKKAICHEVPCST